MRFRFRIILACLIALSFLAGDCDDNGNGNGSNDVYSLDDLKGMEFKLWEWFEAKPETARRYNALNNAAFRGDENGIRAGLRDFFDRQLWVDDGAGRYAIFVVKIYEIYKYLLTEDEQRRFDNTVVWAVDQYINVYGKDSYKQMTIAPLLAYLGKGEANQFINMEWNPYNLEVGSSHYSVLGQYMLTEFSWRIEKAPQEALERLACYLIGVSLPDSRDAYGREYYNVYRGCSLYLSALALVAWKVDNPELKGSIKWIINRNIRYLSDRGLPIYLFPLDLVHMNWDSVPTIKPTIGCFKDRIRRATIKGSPQDVYLRDNFDTTDGAIQIIVLRSGWGEDDIAVKADLAPDANAKGDRNYAGTITGLWFKGVNLVNGCVSYFYGNKSPSYFSAPEGCADYGGEIVVWEDSDNYARCLIDLDGCTREILLDKEQKILQVTDDGANNVYWHFVSYPGNTIEQTGPGQYRIIDAGVEILIECDSADIREVEVGDTSQIPKMMASPHDLTAKLLGWMHEKGGFLNDREIRAECKGNNVKTTFIKSY